MQIKKHRRSREFSPGKTTAIGTGSATGNRIPETYVGNDPRAVRAFCARHNKVIFKPVTGEDYAQIVNQPHLTDEDAELIPFNIPQEVAQQAKAICGALGLEWSGIDWRRTPEGNYIFLEANPSPMFVNFEKHTQLHITQHLAQLLVA